MNSIISVCVPTFNSSTYLKECLDSILHQTFADFELLIVDNCSTDDTVRISQDYADNDPRIRIVQNDRNIGAVGNFNRCVELAGGEWIKFVFSDDLIAPRCLEKMVAEIGPESEIIFCRRDFLFESGISEKTQQYYQNHMSFEDLFPDSKKISGSDFGQAALKHIYINFVGEPTSVLLRRSAFFKFGMFNTHLTQIIDQEFWTRVAVHSGITYIPETLASFRIHTTSGTTTNQATRKYRKDKLEYLILMHDFAFHPIYEPLRAANNDNHSKDLLRLLATHAYDARKIAEKESKSPINPDRSFLKEWQELSKLFPIIERASQPSLFDRPFVDGVWQLKEWKSILKERI